MTRLEDEILNESRKSDRKISDKIGCAIGALIILLASGLTFTVYKFHEAAQQRSQQEQTTKLQNEAERNYELAVDAYNKGILFVAKGCINKSLNSFPNNKKYLELDRKIAERW